MATILTQEGDLPQARSYLEQVVSIFEKTLGKDHPRTQSARQYRAELGKP
jgi:hypothetical protein